MPNPTPHLPLLRRYAALAAIVLLSGCLTIEEHYTFKEDGSGTMEYVLDMSEVGEMLDNMKGLSDGGDGGSTSDMGEQAKQLKGVEGIKRVKFKEEKKGYVQRISFRFQDVAALNRALNVLMPDSTGVQQEFFHWEGNTLVRTNNRHAEEIGNDMAGGPTASDTSGIAEMLKSMKYKYSFRFAKEVASVEQADGVTRESPQPNQVELATDWSVIMKDPKALDLRISVGK
ncbi:hypothetical protein FBQ97_00315 [Acidobacteria bacterium ACD]|nr:hypothetical protein [Acidobacteria bacterium ACD]